MEKTGRGSCILKKKKLPGETMDGQNPTQVGRCLRYLFRVSKNN